MRRSGSTQFLAAIVALLLSVSSAEASLRRLALFLREAVSSGYLLRLSDESRLGSDAFQIRQIREFVEDRSVEARYFTSPSVKAVRGRFEPGNPQYVLRHHDTNADLANEIFVHEFLTRMGKPTPMRGIVDTGDDQFAILYENLGEGFVVNGDPFDRDNLLDFGVKVGIQVEVRKMPKSLPFPEGVDTYLDEMESFFETHGLSPIGSGIHLGKDGRLNLVDLHHVRGADESVPSAAPRWKESIVNRLKALCTMNALHDCPKTYLDLDLEPYR